VIHVPHDEAARVIGKAGRNIEQIEKALGMHIDVRTRDKALDLSPRIEETARHIIIWLSDAVGEPVEVFVGGTPVFTATVGRRGDIRVAKSSEMAKHLLKRLKQGEKIEVQRARLD
jgi:ATPase